MYVMNTKRIAKQLFILIALLMMAALVGCAPRRAEERAAEPQPEAEVVVNEGAAAPADRITDAERPALEVAGVADERAPALPLATLAPAREARTVEAAPDVLLEAAGGGAADGVAAADLALPTGGEAVVAPPDQQFTPLQAGEIDDNENFRAYLDYRSNFHQRLGLTVHDVDITERHTIRVTTRDGLPVLGAEVRVSDGQELVTTLRTTATGQVLFFPRAYPAHAGAQDFEVTVQKGRASTSFRLTREQTDATWPVTLDVPPSRPPVQLDILFLIDATGSMEDEIDELKENILSMSAQIEALPSRPDVRFGLVHYRDRGDVYVTRVSDFTGDVNAFQRALMEVTASGGGDAPESLNEALHRALWDVNWRVADTVSLVFLVADAPPHLDYAQDYDYAEEMKVAAELGVKIFPIGSRLDGPDPDQKVAEYVFRQLAQFTGGNFIFLTYRDVPQSTGEPGTVYDVPEGSYSVEDLDALVVRLVQEELAALAGEQQ